MCSRAHYMLVLLAALSCTVKAQDSQVDDYKTFKVGQSIDIFTRYGFMYISIKDFLKVVPPRQPANETNWMFREPTIDIFNNLQPLTVSPRTPKRNAFNGDFNMDFCDNVGQLLQAYFRHITVERADKPHRLFTASWVNTSLIGRNLGINSSFVNKEHCFVLVRLSRYWDNIELSRIPNNVHLDERVVSEIENIKIGDVNSVMDFIKKYGSHYIHSYTTGNAIFQVFVYKKPVYLRLKERLSAKGGASLTKAEFSNLFSPWYAQHVGNIRATSGNTTIENWAANKLSVQYYIFSYPSIFKVNTDVKILSSLNHLLRDEAVLQMDLRTLAPAFKDPQKRAWYEDVLDNNMKLWDSNL